MVFGGLADRFGRVKAIQVGFVLSIVGSLLIGFVPSGGSATLLMMVGRILQGLSAALIMPASLALVKAYWDGEGRQRAISILGRLRFCRAVRRLDGGNVGWRSIFFAGAALSALGMWMVAGTPESKAPADPNYRFDLGGVLLFTIMMVSLQIVLTQGGQFGWLSATTIGLFVTSAVFSVFFVRHEMGSDNAFVDFSLFKNVTFTGATLSNFLLNATSGVIVVAMSLMQLGAEMSAQGAGFLTLGYALVIVSCIRVGEKLLQKYGPRKPMLWGSWIVGLSIILLMQTYLTAEAYKILAVIAFSLFGLGLAFYATSSTDAALSSLPAAQSGSGSGIYKMASSLGASFGVAISATVFTVMNSQAGTSQWTEGLLSFIGRQDNIATREAGLVAMGVNLLMLFAALASIMLTIPKQDPATKENQS